MLFLCLWFEAADDYSMTARSVRNAVFRFEAGHLFSAKKD